MISRTTSNKLKPASFQSRQTRFIDQSFQLKYTFQLVALVSIALIAGAAPSYYFIYQNYETFIDIAYDVSPGLVIHLEREITFLGVLFTCIFLSSVSFFYLAGLRLTTQIIAPIKLVGNHLKLLSRGIWHAKPLNIRDTDEFHDFIEQYNYFYHSFQTYLKRDLQKLETMSIDPSDGNTYFAWRELIQEKRAQLNKTKPTRINETFVKPEPNHDSLHAS